MPRPLKMPLFHRVRVKDCASSDHGEIGWVFEYLRPRNVCVLLNREMTGKWMTADQLEIIDDEEDHDQDD